MKKITLLLIVLCAFTLVGNAQVMGTSSPAAAIPDNDDVTGLDDVITIGATSGTVTDVVVDLQITHTWVGDIKVTLTAPDATSTSLIWRPGNPALTFGCSESNINTTISDAGATTTEDICDAADPSIGAGPYLAQSDNDGTSVSLAATFNGIDATGDWTLNVTDNAAGDTGTLDSWTITISGPSLGVEDNALKAFEYYPNPVKDNFTVNAANTINSISVYNLLGQEVLRATPNALSSNLNMSELQSGAYLVRISSGDITETIRIVKQ